MRFLSLMIPALLLAVPASAETYEIDAGHTTIGFSIGHMGVSNTIGRFADFAGTVNLTDGKLEATSANLTIEATSIYTGVQKRDDHLRNDDFFDVTNHAQLTFKSTAVKNVTKDGFDLVGDLTIMGTTKPVTVSFTGLSAEVDDPWGSKRRGASGTATVKRSDYGMSYGIENGVISDEVDVRIELELQRKP